LEKGPHTKATKAKFVQQLLDTQIVKDDKFVDPKNLHKHFPEHFKSPETTQKELESAIRNKPKNARIFGKLEMRDYLTFPKISDVCTLKKRKLID
jgi:hypothetical protein